MPNSNRDKGLRAERDVAQYFRDAGIATAERRVVTGWHRTDRSDPDLGDIKGVPGICIQVKDVVVSYPRGLAGKALAEVMAQTMTQCDAASEVVPLLIEKRTRIANPGEWWAWLPGNIYSAITTGCDPYGNPTMWNNYPVRTELHNIITQLVQFSAMCSEEAA
jgi:hypothetical protein